VPVDPLGAELKQLNDRIYSLERRGTYPSWVADASWNVISTFSNSWTNYDASWPTAAYRVDSEGWLIMRGLLRSGTLNSVAFTLPAAYRPQIMQVVRTNANDAAAWIQIGTDGQVLINSSSNAYVSLFHVQIPLWNTNNLRLTKLGLPFYTPETANRHHRLYLRRSGMWELTGMAATMTMNTSYTLAGTGPDFSDIYWAAGTTPTAGRVDIGLNNFTNPNTFTPSTNFSILSGIRWPDTSIEPDYTGLTLQNSWAYFGVGGSQWAQPGYYKDSNGYVHLRGLIKDGSSSTATIATLPAGFRPGFRTIFATYGAPGIVGIEVSSAGVVAPRNASTRTYLSLAGISFLAEN
jgi:hypothetical protein